MERKRAQIRWRTAARSTETGHAGFSRKVIESRDGNTRHVAQEQESWLAGPALTPELLRDCEGFWVHSAGGRVGIVEELRYVGASDVPESIAVQVRPFGTRLLIVPVEEIVEISAFEERVTIRSSPRISALERIGPSEEIERP